MTDNKDTTKKSVFQIYFIYKIAQNSRKSSDKALFDLWLHESLATINLTYDNFLAIIKNDAFKKLVRMLYE